MYGITSEREVQVSRNIAVKLLTKWFESDWLAERYVSTIETKCFEYDRITLEKYWSNMKGLKAKEKQQLIAALDDVRVGARYQFAVEAKKQMLFKF